LAFIAKKTGNVPFAAFFQTIQKKRRETKDYKQLFFKTSGDPVRFFIFALWKRRKIRNVKTVVYHLQQKEKYEM
jgi:hypothetical protein